MPSDILNTAFAIGFVTILFIVFNRMKRKGAKVIDLDVSERPYHEDQKLISSKTKQQ